MLTAILSSCNEPPSYLVVVENSPTSNFFDILHYSYGKELTLVGDSIFYRDSFFCCDPILPEDNIVAIVFEQGFHQKHIDLIINDTLLISDTLYTDLSTGMSKSARFKRVSPKTLLSLSVDSELIFEGLELGENYRYIRLNKHQGKVLVTLSNKDKDYY